MRFCNFGGKYILQENMFYDFSKKKRFCGFDGNRNLSFFMGNIIL